MLVSMAQAGMASPRSAEAGAGESVDDAAGDEEGGDPTAVDGSACSPEFHTIVL